MGPGEGLISVNSMKNVDGNNFITEDGIHVSHMG